MIHLHFCKAPFNLLLKRRLKQILKHMGLPPKSICYLYAMHSGFPEPHTIICLTGCFVKGKPPSGHAKTSWFAASNDIIHMYAKFSDYILSIFRLYIYTITCQLSISPKSNLQFAAPTLRPLLKNPLNGAAK